VIGSAPEKVLIIKPSSLGDVVSGIPVLRGLRRSFPEARLAWMVVPGCADILTGESQLDEVIEFDRRHYEIAPTSRKSVTALFHPARKPWVLEEPPKDTWPSILGGFTL